MTDLINTLFTNDHDRVRSAAADTLDMLTEAGPQGCIINGHLRRRECGRIGRRGAQVWIWDIARDRLIKAGVIRVARNYKVGSWSKTYALANPSDECLAPIVGRFCAVDTGEGLVKGWLLAFDADTVTIKLPRQHAEPAVYPRHSFRSLDRATTPRRSHEEDLECLT